MTETFGMLAILVVAGTVWFIVWAWRQRRIGVVHPRPGDQRIDEMPIRMPPD